MKANALLRDKVNKAQIPLERLVEEYLLVCRTEGKSPKPFRSYRENLTTKPAESDPRVCPAASTSGWLLLGSRLLNQASSFLAQLSGRVVAGVKCSYHVTFAQKQDIIIVI